MLQCWMWAAQNDIGVYLIVCKLLHKFPVSIMVSGWLICCNLHLSKFADAITQQPLPPVWHALARSVTTPLVRACPIQHQQDLPCMQSLVKVLYCCRIPLQPGCACSGVSSTPQVSGGSAQAFAAAPAGGTPG